MARLFIDLGESRYPIYIEEGLFYQIPRLLFGEYPDHFLQDPWKDTAKKDVVVITDDNVSRIYQQEIDQLLKTLNGIKITIPPTEKSKSLSMVEKVAETMVKEGVDRKGIILAIGGGVVGDLAGFLASVYMRGLPYFQIPTTLLSQVDSSVGGKTGVNLTMGKNLIGAFYQPKAVFIDPAFLRTLEKKEITSGLAEILKTAIIWDEEFYFEVKETIDKAYGLDAAVLESMLKRSCEIKGEIVSLDEKEKGLRKILNFGHTVGHAIEKLDRYEGLTHGEAVAVGMLEEVKIGKKLGVTPQKVEDEILAGLDKILPHIDYQRQENPTGIIQAMLNDKKNQGDKISFILPSEIGKVEEVYIDGIKFRDLWNA